MKQQLKHLTICLSLLGVVSFPAIAQAKHHSNSHKTQQLQSRLASLEHELAELKAQVGNPNPSLHVKKRSHLTAKQSPQPQVINDAQTNTAQATNANDNAITGPFNLPDSGLQYLGRDLDAPGKSYVTTGPYIGVPLAYSGNNLIINNPSINEDVSLLILRKNIRERLRKAGVVDPTDHAHLLLSGVIEGQMMLKKPGNGPFNSDIDLTSAGLDGYILGPTSWLSGLISFSYDNDLGTNSGSLNNRSRVENSRVFINKAFVTIGDFEKTPVYSTIGQMYVPFGTYSSSMISSPMTKVIGRTKARALLVGFQQQTPDAFYGSAYLFNGSSYVGSVRRIDNGGVNVGYKFVADTISGNIGGGVISNIADAEGMQNTGGAPQFGGFGGSNGSGNERIMHRVSAMDVRGLVSIGSSIDLLAEYVAATNAFSRADMTFNSHGAKPQALNAEAAYTFSTFSKPTSVAFGYGKTKDALALGVPLERFGVTLNTSLWKDSLQSLEFRHDVNYAAASYATGSNLAAMSASGKSDNVLTAQFDMYF